MADTISALDTATTDELIAALVARHRATLGQACSHLDDIDALLNTARALDLALHRRIWKQINNASAEMLKDHTTFTDADPTRAAEALIRIIQESERGSGR